jgi:hypothetical protein
VGSTRKVLNLQVNYSLTIKYYTILKRLAKVKHSSLFGLFVGDREKLLTTLTLVGNLIS